MKAQQGSEQPGIHWALAAQQRPELAELGIPVSTASLSLPLVQLNKFSFAPPFLCILLFPSDRAQCNWLGLCFLNFNHIPALLPWDYRRVTLIAVSTVHKTFQSFRKPSLASFTPPPGSSLWCVDFTGLRLRGQFYFQVHGRGGRHLID